MPFGFTASPREQLLIEKDVQCALLMRAGLHATALAVYFTVTQFFAQSIDSPDAGIVELFFRLTDEAIYWGPGLMLLGPLIAYDILKLTNRFSGPVFRLRREMDRLIADESKQPLSFRDEDYWADLADRYNQLREEIITLREQRELWQATGGMADSDVNTSQVARVDEDAVEGDGLVIESVTGTAETGDHAAITA